MKRSPVFKTAFVYASFLATSANLRYQVSPRRMCTTVAPVIHFLYQCTDSPLSLVVGRKIRHRRIQESPYALPGYDGRTCFVQAEFNERVSACCPASVRGHRGATFSVAPIRPVVPLMLVALLGLQSACLNNLFPCSLSLRRGLIILFSCFWILVEHFTSPFLVSLVLLILVSFRVGLSLWTLFHCLSILLFCFCCLSVSI